MEGGMGSLFAKRVLGFGVVGIISTLVSLMLIVVFNEVLRWNMYVSYLLSYFISILVSYIFNSSFVWKAEFKVKAVFKYFLIYGISMVIGALILQLLELMFPETNHTLLSCMTVPVTFSWNYLFVNKLLSIKNGR